jgi:CheY-like chemotaxis protein
LLSSRTASRFVGAVTGFGRPDEVKECLQTGCDMHLLKPSDPLALKHLLDFRVQQTFAGFPWPVP